MKKINFAFFGTPELAASTLDYLFKNQYLPKVVVTAPPKRAGRGMHLINTPVYEWAINHNIPCLTPININQEFIALFKKYDVELSIVIAYGKILPSILIDLPKLGTINIHYSLLPKYRGASPIESCLLNDEKYTGVSLQKMVFKLDSGPIFALKSLEVLPDETSMSLRNKLTDLGGELLCKTLPEIINENLTPIPQNENDATYCHKIRKEDGEIDPNLTSCKNYNKYRAYYSYPGVYFFTTKNDRKIRIKITSARYENNTFIIEKVIPEGKKEIQYTDFLRNKI